MGKLLLFIAVAFLLAAGAAAQPVPRFTRAGLDTTRSILRNGVAVMEARGDSLWVGPYLNLTTDGGQTWQAPDLDSLGLRSRNMLYALDVEGPVLWAGLGYSAFGSGDAAAGGLLVSTDGGRTFDYRLPPLDTAADTVVVYGVSRLPALPVVAPEQSPPYDVDYAPRTGVLWTAGGMSGLRFSTDGGRTFRRAVLPPDTLRAIRPDEHYDFLIAPATVSGGFLNYVTFSVLVDETGTVWAGTVAGVNRSRPQDVMTVGGVSYRAWRRYGTEDGLPATQVIALAEQPLPGRNPIWLAALQPAVPGAAGQQRGVAFTRDGGRTFEQTLLGERINDFAFRGETIYAAGSNGLFILDASGAVVEVIRRFQLRNRSGAAPEVPVLAVTTTPGTLWAGTPDGLFKSTDGGQTWRVFRAEVPLHPDEPAERIPNVETYAYPNPFSPAASPSGRVRIVVETPNPEQVAVRIFDFGMNLVRRLDGPCLLRGDGRTCEIAWAGTDAAGRRVANGVYFYVAETGGGTVRGKILVLR